MFKEVPKDLPTRDPVAVTLHEMDRYGIQKGLIGVSAETSQLALKRHPDRFLPVGSHLRSKRRRRIGARDPTRVPGVWDPCDVGVSSGTFPQVPIDDPKMYPIYSTCVELGIPIFICAGVPGPRLPFAPHDGGRIDIVMFDFPELVFVTRHGCEQWEQLAVKLMLKWPNRYYWTSAFAPKYYPKVKLSR
jgi:hypothetical protein